MADDVDRSLVRLAVEAGFLTRDEGMRYWQQLQAPGSPRFVQLLLRSGRLGRAEVDRLRTLWQQQSGAQSPSGITAAFARPTGGPAQVATPANAAAQEAPARGPTGQNPASTDDGSWEEALEKDTQLARTLYGRGLVTQERLRECRALQLQHRLRLGVILVRKNYVDRAAMDDALRSLGASGPPPALSASTGPPAGAALGASTRVQAPGSGLGASTRMQTPSPPLGASGHMGRPAPMTPSNPFQVPAGAVDQDAMPTLNVPPGGFPPGGSFSTPRTFTPQDVIPTLLGAPSNVSVEELNPFAVMGNGPSVARAAGPGPGRGPGGAPGVARGDLSVDELNAFDDVPLGPPPPGGPDQAAASGEDITLPPSWSPVAPQAVEAPADGARGGAGDLPDSGGERPAAEKPKKKAPARRSTPAPSGGGGGKAIIIFVVIAALVAAAAGAYLAFG